MMRGQQLLLLVLIFPLMGMAQTVSVLRKEAEQGSVAARLRLAECYALGLDCPQNQDSVLYFLKPLVKSGHPEACFLTGNTLIRRDNQVGEGIRYLQQAADSGQVQAIKVLLEVFSGKDAGSPFAPPALKARKNDAALFRTAQMANLHNEPFLSFYLGMCYLEGRGTGKNDSLALKWLDHSASWSFCSAQLVLGDVWFKGQTRKGYDLLKAREYYQSARDNNRCSIDQKGAGREGEMWVDRCFHLMWNTTWFATGLLEDFRYAFPVPDVKAKDYVKNRYPE